MRTSSFFGQLRSAYASEIDDMTFDSEGKNVLRQRLAARQRADAGEPWWPSRPFGLTLSGVIDPVEGPLIRTAYTEVLAGSSLRAIAQACA